MSPYQTSVVFHQVELYSLNAAVITAGVNLGRTNSRYIIQHKRAIYYMNICSGQTKRNHDSLRLRTTLLCTVMHITTSL